MIKQWILHVEWHKGYWPHISLCPKIKHGQIGSDGGEIGHFIHCDTCSGTGTLFVPDKLPPLRTPTNYLESIQGPHCKHYGGTDPCPPDRPDWWGLPEGHVNLGGPSIGRRTD